MAAEQSKGEECLEERVELSMLYDFYGALLKENQRRMFEANVLEDYSFAEIAQEEGISRQGAYDAIRRASKQLRDYEEKLGLVERFEQQAGRIKQLKEKFVSLGLEEKADGWQEVMAMLEQILEEI